MTAVQPDKPPVLPVEPDAIPAELRALPQWILWRLEWDYGRNEWTKRPYSARNGKLASTTDSLTWDTFSNALRVYRGGRFDGIGFVFSRDDPYVGVDLDHVCENGAPLEPWASAAIALLDSYTERSVRGGGVHIIVRGALPAGRRKRGPAEMYSEGRYFTVTGALVDGRDTIADRTAQLAQFHAEYLADDERKHAAPVPLTPSIDDDAALIERAKQAANGAKFAALWAGDWSGYPSQSEADQALCNALAFWCRDDATRIDRLFRMSGLMRPKWDQRRGAMTYGEKTVTGALASASARETASPRAKDQPRYTDIGNAERLVAAHGADFRYCAPFDGWMVWTGRQWLRDQTGEIERRAKQVALGLYHEAAELGDDSLRDALLKHAKRSNNNSGLLAMVRRAQVEPGIPALPEEFDARLDLLVALNGVLEGLTR